MTRFLRELGVVESVSPLSRSAIHTATMAPAALVASLAQLTGLGKLVRALA